MPSLSDICSVLGDRLLLDLQRGGAAAAWMALQLELKYAVGLQGAMDSTACTGTSKNGAGGTVCSQTNEKGTLTTPSSNWKSKSIAMGRQGEESNCEAAYN